MAAPVAPGPQPLAAPLLDVKALGEAAVRAGYTGFGLPSIARVHFSTRRPVVIQLHDFGGETLLAEVLGEAAAEHAAAETERLSKSRRSQVSRHARSPVVADQATGLVFRPPGFDARLPGLKLLHDPEATLAVCSALKVGLASVTPRVRLMAHRLGKRAVLRIQAGGETVFARLGPTSNDGPARAFRHHSDIADALADRVDVAVPRPLGFDAELGAAMYSGLPGRPQCLDGPTGIHDTRATLRALAAVQTLPHDGLRQHGVAEELALLRDWAARVEWLRPEWLDHLAAASEFVATHLSQNQSATPVFCHRDFHEGQILIGADRAGIMDFDTAAVADPVLDVGNLAAHYHLHGLRHGVDTREVQNLALMGVEERRNPDARQRAAIWRRAALLRLACLYALTSEPDTVIRGLFESAVA